MLQNLIHKYQLLHLSAQKELMNFLEDLLQKQESHIQNQTSYKEKLLKVSKWKEEDLQVFEVTKEAFQQWNISKW